jgi:tight adherence protein B
MIPLLNVLARDPDLLAAAVFGGALLLVVLVAALWSVVFEADERRLQRRVDRVQSPRSGGSGDRAKPMESLRRNKQDSSIASIDRVIKRLLPNLGLMRLRLERAGWSLKVGDFLLICLGLSIATVLALTLSFDFSLMINGPLGLIVGLAVPNLVLRQRITRRTKKFVSLMPDALDLIVRGIRSGLPASEALKTIAEEIEDPIGKEFRQISDQMKIGVAMDEAMWSTARRLGIAEFNFLVISLSIQQETGGNLAEILEKLSDMVRRREQMRLKVKAMSSEARASAGIIGALPFIMCGVISFVSPGYMSVLFNDPRGWVMIGLGFTSLATGIGVMSKMIKFDI